MKKRLLQLRAANEVPPTLLDGIKLSFFVKKCSRCPVTAVIPNTHLPLSIKSYFWDCYSECEKLAAL